MKIGIICSIKYAPEEYTTNLYNYVAELEAKGHTVHFPPRDTNQQGTSLEICTSNINAFRECEEIHISYRHTSLGTHFDLGAVFAMGKKLVSIEPVQLTEGKSFQNLIYEYSR